MTRLVIGVGNRDRGDDAVGPFVADAVAAAGAPHITATSARCDPGDLVTLWTGHADVVLIDACVSGGRAGDVHRFDARAAPLPAAFDAVSTHGFGLAAAIELARATFQLPDSLVLYAVEAECFEPGAPMTGAVAAAAQGLIATLLAHASERDL